VASITAQASTHPRNFIRNQKTLKGTDAFGQIRRQMLEMAELKV
jgi:hypothetical protein